MIWGKSFPCQFFESYSATLSDDSAAQQYISCG